MRAATPRLLEAAILALVAVVAKGVMAMGPPVLPQLAFYEPTIPADGALLIREGEVELVELRVEDSMAQPIAGELAPFMDGFAHWRPTAPLTPGEQYTAYLVTERFGTEQQRFSAEQPWVPWLQEPAAAAELVIRELPEQLCCTTLETPVEQTCFERSLTRTAQVRLAVDSAEPAWHQNQFLYQVEGEDVWQEGLPVRQRSVAMEGERHCYQIRVRHLFLPIELMWPEVCFDVGTLPSLGIEEYPIDANLAVDVCEVPPRYYEDEWCAVNEAVCEGATDAVCAQHADLCTGFSLTVHDGAAPAGGAGAGGAREGGAAGAGGTNQDETGVESSGDAEGTSAEQSEADASAGGTGGQSGAAAPDASAHESASRRTGGCSAAPTRADASAWPALAFALLVRRRRRRGRTSV